jgi:hypothetical protein
MSLRHALALSLIMATLSACAPTWKHVDQAIQLESIHEDYTLQLPLGWVKRGSDSADLLVTRDGPALNYILVNRQPHERKLPKTKRETRADMLPHELAELAVAEWKSTEATANLEVLASEPAMLGGKPAARVHIRYKNQRGLPIERILVAMVDSKGRLFMVFEAPSIVYFARGLPAFEAMVASVTFKQAVGDRQ